MFISATILAAVAFAGVQEAQTSCPIMGEPASAKVAKVLYNGIEVGFCCGGCDGTFKNDPVKALKKSAENKLTVGVFLFDPISKNRIEPKKAAAHTDYAGIRFYFESAANKAAFEKDPKANWSLTTKESTTCPVMGGEIKSVAKASEYVDYKGTRYYTCCPGCVARFKADPEAYAAKAKVVEAKAVTIAK
ncbi:MAG: hypothetical protein HONBIEJF_00509 [Fimbriimonadaceae bacterium]|nr:hypothetical protein [Fimbriimonadaceae bacterium]